MARGDPELASIRVTSVRERVEIFEGRVGGFNNAPAGNWPLL